ncbi:MAG: acetate kinase [Lachnospiraceae bacterium]|nr:acetate kinase [Lachnospiraceae bacterium]
MKILVINCGSSSLKFQLIDSVSEDVLAKGLCERIGIDGSQIVYTPLGGKSTVHDKITTVTPMKDHTVAVQLVIDALTDTEHGVIDDLGEIDAVGHRVVHGGEEFSTSVIIDEKVKEAIRKCSDLAPLHNPANLIGIDACERLMPGVPQVAVFDTAFHQTMPEKAYLYGLPYEYYEKYRVRRYGFHGTSHAFVSSRCAQLMGRDISELKIIVAHLGNGASLSAVQNGKCVDTSMGLTPLEGVIMGTRSGDIDPAIMQYIAAKENLTMDEVMDVLNKKSGVLGLSGGFSSDFRDLEAGYNKGEANCIRAIETYCLRVAKYIGSYAAAMNGVDAICFTAGVGENGPMVRAKICEYLGFMGVKLDPIVNAVRGDEAEISAVDSKVKVFNLPTNEELAIARETVNLV